MTMSNGRLIDRCRYYIGMCKQACCRSIPSNLRILFRLTGLQDWKAALNRFIIQLEDRSRGVNLNPVYTKFRTPANEQQDYVPRR